jgi:hypothetical protein
VTYSTTVDIPFSATGTATLNYVGEDSRAAYYLAGGTMTLWSQSLAIRGTTCTPLSPTATQRTSVAELVKEPPDFFFAINALWDLQCIDGTRTAVATTFDSEGVSLFRCPRIPVGTPILSPSHLQGAMTIDCGSDGQVTGSWDLSPGLTAAALPPPRRASRAR